MLTVLCHTQDEDGNSFTDEDIVNHMIFLMMAAHDTSTSTTTTMAYHLAANPEWQERCRDESDRLGDGPLDIEALEKLETLDLVMNESLRLVTPLPFNMRQTVRDTDLLGYYLPAGTNVITWPGINHWLPELWTDPLKFDPERFTRAAQRAQAAPVCVRPVRRRRAQVHRHGVRPLEIKTILHRLLRRYRLELARPGYQPQVGLRRHADPDGRHADRVAAASSCVALRVQPVRAGDDRRQGGLRRVLRAAHRPLGTATVGALDEGRGRVVGLQLMELQHFDGDAVLVQHRGQRGDRAVRGGSRGFDAVAERQRGLESPGSQPGGRSGGVGAVPLPETQRSGCWARRWR